MTEPDQPENQMEQFPPHNPSEAGAINMTELVNRASEVISITVNAGRVAYHGLSEVLSIAMNEGRVFYHGRRAAISKKRMEMAGGRMEKMDHKDALYTAQSGYYDVLSKSSVLSGLPPSSPRVRREAVHGATRRTSVSDPGYGPDTIKPEARTLVERFMIHRLEKKLTRQELARADKKRVNTAFAGPKSETNRLLPRPLTTSGRQEIANRLRTEHSYWTSGNPDPRGRRIELNEAKANPIKSEKTHQRKVRKKEDKRIEKFDTASGQPMLRRFRRLRRDGKIVRGERYGGAINDIKRHHHRAEKHRKKREDLLI